MAPVGPTGFPIGPTVDGPRIALGASALRLGPGLTLSSDAEELLGRAMVVDDMGFPFPVDLGKAARATERDSGLSAFISADRRSVAATAGSGASIAAFIPEDDITDWRERQASVAGFHRAGDEERVPLNFTADMSTNAAVFASFDVGSEPRLGLGAELAERRATLMQTGAFVDPHGKLADASSGVGFSLRPAEGTEIAVSAFGSMAEGEGPEAFLQRFEIMQVMPGDIELRFGLALLQEEDGFIGGSASGAFGDDTSARSRFMTIAVLGPLAEHVDGFVTYSRGRSSIGGGEGALLADWTTTRSEAFGVGVVMRDLVKANDGLTLTVGQPFRQDRAEATIDLPVAREPDGNMVTTRQNLDFAPKAREITTEIGYRLPLDQDGDHDVQAAGFLRLNPDHDDSRQPEAGIGLSYRWRF